MSEFISRSRFTEIKRVLCEMAAEQVRQAATPELANEIAAAAQAGGVAAVRAVLEAKRDELDKSVERLVAAAIAEIRADEA